MATINYFIQSKNNPAGIYVRLREGRNIDAKAKTKYAINPKDWSTTKGQPKNLDNVSFKKLHEDLIKESTDLLNHYNKSVKTHTINTQWLKDFISPPIEAGAIPNKLIEYFDYYSLHKKSTIGASTHTKLNVNKHLVERFQKTTKTEYFIKDVNADFKLKFEEYCVEQNYAQNTIARTIKFIKTICYHARNNGIEAHFQLNSINSKIEKVEKIFLTIDEIDKIQNKKLESESLINARDWLIISCETGQRVSDFMRFKKEQIRYEGNVPLIEFAQVKTGKTMAIPLSKKVLAILEKREGEFPRQISDQRYNEYIKEVCKIAKLTERIKGSKPKTEDKVTRKESGTFEKWELITSHIGRRSFATNNYGRIPTSLLINVTGHSTETMFLEYIGKTVTEKAIQLAEYF
ncbi:MAG: site-specific integrase [Bacteroidota bacterium]|nr:site-specific integrase [Bacteroidota bacterium]